MVQPVELFVHLQNGRVLNRTRNNAESWVMRTPYKLRNFCKRHFSHALSDPIDYWEVRGAYTYDSRQKAL